MAQLEYSEAWVRAHYARIGKPLPPMLEAGSETPAPPRRTKYGNRRVEQAGMTFDSQHEANRWGELQLLLQSGEILGVWAQVPFMLPGGVVYRADFVVLERGGVYRVEDAKSSATAKDKTYRLKRRLMRECLGIAIVEV